MNRSWAGRCSLVLLGLIVNCGWMQADQTNSWNSSTSGNWEDSTWSLGVPPGAGQTVLLSNHGWKAIAIGAATAANHPETVTVDALTVTSPGTDTVNTVLFNYAGFQTPFATQSLNVSNDARVVVLGTALTVAHGKLVVDAGTVTEDAGSQVSAGGLQVLDGGLYDLVNGSFAVPQPGQEGISNAVFRQEGGSNYCFWLADYGEYDFSGGDLVGAPWEEPGTAFHILGNFIQTGGTLTGQMNVGEAGTGTGTYALSNGIVNCASLAVPWSGYGSTPDNMSFFVQTGGTNFSGTVYLGALTVQYGEYPWFGVGNYSLFNGLLVTSNLFINGRGGVTQFGGVHNNTTIMMTQNQFLHQEQPGGNSYVYNQPGAYSLTDGTLTSGLLDMEPGNFSQSGGSAQITTLQSVGGHYGIGGGQLTVSNITLSGGASFLNNGGTVSQSGTLTLAASSLTAISGSQQFGKLLLSNVGGTNSTVDLQGGNGTVSFANSSGLAWSNAATLTITDWKGSAAGGGSQQILFGNDNTGLTAQQVSQIQFSFPLGLPGGIYSAKLLSNGELVPGLIQGQGPTNSGPVNSWFSQTGGNWDDASSWWLGVVPDSTQDVMFTNAFWKAITIDASTVSSAPGSLVVKSLTILSLSPTDGSYTSKNTLLLNYVQPGNPLVIGVDTNTPGSLLVDSNSIMAMYYSGLVVNDALGQSNSPLGNFQVDGNFIQSDNSEVVAGFLDLNGTYNMTNGQLFVGTQFINGTFNQQGGTNTGSMVDGTNGNYQLFDGAFNGDITLEPGIFQQWGGTISGPLTFAGGLYKLANGLLLPGDLNIGALPVADFFDLNGGGIMQSGGTNNPDSFTLGKGYYYLSNGVLNASSMTLTTNTWVAGLFAADFEQFGGYVTNGELTMIGGTNVDRGQTIIAPAKYHLYGGALETPSITMNFGNFTLAGIGLNATNRVATLSMNDSIYAMGNGGFLVVDQLKITNSSQFWHQGGALAGARNIILANGEWAESSTGAQLGQLHLMSGTNSSVYLTGSCVLQFASSSVVPWASDGMLTIGGWSGSFTGGGAQQILFGSSASGLTAQQLSQMRFLNPAGVPNGTYGAKILSTGEVVPDQSSSSAGPVNSWINPASGNWDDASSWSLGVLPNSSQSAVIANSGSKAVAINPSTPVNFPGSMTVNNLFINGATNTVNTLLLNNFGTAVPLTVSNSLLMQSGGQILNFNSGLLLQGTAIEITNSAIIQDGGFIRATNGQVTLSGSRYDISNGVFEASSVALGFPVPSRLNQYGGSVKIGNVGLTSYEFGTNDSGISLYGGMLELPGGMFMLGGRPELTYFQAGGTNYTTQITIEPGYGGGNPGFTLNGGLLADSGVMALGGPKITQNGGAHIVTNTISLIGESIHGEAALVSTYNLNGGTLVAGGVNLNAEEGTAAFNETNGVAYIGDFQGTSQPYESYWGAAVSLSGGMLACSNFLMSDSGTITQSTGALVVTNTLTVTGFIQPGPKIYSKYQFTDGTLSASNINIGGIWNIGDSAGTNRITNPGTCTLSHSLTIGNAAEQLGQFILGGSATIDLAGSSSRLSFANSSGQAWTNGTVLIIADWNGNASGGGDEQLNFGGDSSGLTTAQLQEIQFRISTNLYSAKILNTGEVVPDQLIASPLTFTQQGNQLTLNWPAGYTLQSAPNPNGPFQNVTDPFIVTPPYTVNMNQPQQYFRIVPQ